MSLMHSNINRYLWDSESTYGTDAVEANILGADADRNWQDARNIDITPTGEVVHVPRQRGSVAGNKHGFIKSACEVSGELPVLPYISAAEQVPYYDAIFKAMGLEPDLSVGTEATYTPSTKAQSAATIYKYMRNVEDDNWRLQVVTGARLNGTFTFETDAEPMFSIEGVGQYSRLTDPAAFIDNSTGAAALLKDGSTAVTALTTGTEQQVDQTPLMCSNLTFTVDGTAHTIGQLELNLGWTVDQINAITGDSTMRKSILTRDDTGGRPSGSFNLVDMSEAVLNAFLDEYESAAESSIVLVADNGTDKVTWTMNKVQIGVPEMDSNGNLRTFTIPFFLNADWSELAADNDLEILFSAV